jgi:TonB-linked SusC/RagA family outer membrane protein
MKTNKTQYVYLFLLLGTIFSWSSYAQEQITVKGVVIASDSNTPLPGVNILEKGSSNNGTATDFNGNYTINVASDATLVVSYVGFKTQEIPVQGKETINISLDPNNLELSQVVVIGYGTARRKDLAGAVSTVDVENSPIANIPTTNVLQNLQGKVGGLNIAAQNSPGSTPGILVRGQNSINGSNSPLIVLDGIIFTGSLSDINPNDIARYDILKDASAAAAYGSRAANGVIVITTKKGKSGKPVINFQTTTGFNTWQNKFDMMGLQEYERKYAVQNNQEVGSIVFDDEARNKLLAQRVNTKWMDLISRSGLVQNNQVSISGSSDKINYYLSGGYNKEEGVIKGDDFERISLTAKINTHITDWLEVGINGIYNNNDNSGIAANIADAYRMAPIGYPYRWQSMPNDVASATGKKLERWPTGSSIQNPLWGTEGTIQDINKNDFFRFAGHAVVKAPFLEGLSYRFNYSIDAHYYKQDRFNYEDYYVNAQGQGNYIERYSPSSLQTHLSQANGSNSRTNDYSYLMDHILNFKRTFGDHYIDFTLVATRDFSHSKTVRVTGSDFSANGNTELGVNGIHKAAVIKSDINVVERSNVGYLARLNYSFKDRYHLTASIRRDGASVFGDKKKYGDFPSVGVAWTASEEDFLRGNETLSYLKLKASYGQNGNQGVGPYGTLARVASGNDGGIRYEFGDNPSQILYGVQLTSLANPNLGWETTTSFNGGFESRFFNDRISLDFDFYFSKTTDQIFQRRIPIMTGFSSILSSLGQVDNKGLEINLTSKNIETEDFNWESSLIYWINRNKLVSLYGDDLNNDGVEDDDLANNLFIGKSLGAIYSYKYDGVVQQDDTEYIKNVGAVPGDPKFVDLNGDGVITADGDREILGYRKPNFRMSLSNTVTYKDFTFYIQLHGVFGGGKDNYFLRENPRGNSFFDRFDTNEISHPYWTPENKSEKYLRPDYNGNRYLGLQSRGYLRIQDVSFSYNFPQKLTDKIGVGALKLYTSVSNPYTFTNWYGGGDPDLGIRPGDGTYPVPTTYSVGLNLSL